MCVDESAAVVLEHVPHIGSVVDGLREDVRDLKGAPDGRRARPRGGAPRERRRCRGRSASERANGPLSPIASTASSASRFVATTSELTRTIEGLPLTSESTKWGELRLAPSYFRACSRVDRATAASIAWRMKR